MRFVLHVFSIFQRPSWHYAIKFDTLSDVLLFFRFKIEKDERCMVRLYRVTDILYNEITYYKVVSGYKKNHLFLVDQKEAEEYQKIYVRKNEIRKAIRNM